MRRLRPLAVNVLLSLAVTAAVLALLEGAFRMRERRRAPVVVADYIWNWEKKWAGDFYTIRSDAVGWPPWEEFNADGVRDRTHTVEKPDDVWRVAFLGDSVTLGAGLAPAEAYPQVLQTKLDAEGRGTEVFNVALWGWSTRQQRLAWERLARKYRLDQVVLAVCLNDIPELHNNLAQPPRLLAALHRRSALVRAAVDAEGRAIESVEQLFHQPDAPKVREAFAEFFAEVRALRRAVKADGGRFDVVVFPFRFQLAPDAPPPLAQRRILEFCEAEGVRCFDLLDPLQRWGPSAFLDYDHLSTEGTALVADHLLESGLLPAPSFPRRALVEHIGAPDGVLPVADLARALKHPREPIRREAARALGEVVPEDHAAAAAALFGALSDDRETVRAQAARSLSQTRLTTEAVPALVAALPSRDPYVSSFAAWTLGGLGPAAASAVPALVQALEREEGFGRGGAAAALAKMGPAAEAAVPALVQALSDADGDRRWKAARTLGRIGPVARSAVPALTRALADENEYVRLQSARALGRIGATERAAVDALERAAHDGDDAVKKAARQALATLSGG
jgi:HEAT repeat protein/lysophospholipase L1-like esterase